MWVFRFYYGSLLWRMGAWFCWVGQGHQIRNFVGWARDLGAKGGHRVVGAGSRGSVDEEDAAFWATGREGKEMISRYILVRQGRTPCVFYKL